jgi:hypothetical protein
MASIVTRCYSICRVSTCWPLSCLFPLQVSVLGWVRRGRGRERNGGLECKMCGGPWNLDVQFFYRLDREHENGNHTFDGGKTVL